MQALFTEKDAVQLSPVSAREQGPRCPGDKWYGGQNFKKDWREI